MVRRLGMTWIQRFFMNSLWTYYGLPGKTTETTKASVHLSKSSTQAILLRILICFKKWPAHDKSHFTQLFFCPSFSISFLNWDEGIQQYPLHANIRPLFIQGSFIGKVFWILLNARKKVHYRRQSKNNTGFSELCSYIECCFAK